MSNQSDDRISIKQAAAESDRSVRTIWRWVSSGLIPVTRNPAGGIYIKRSDLLKQAEQDFENHFNRRDAGDPSMR